MAGILDVESRLTDAVTVDLPEVAKVELPAACRPASSTGADGRHARWQYVHDVWRLPMFLLPPGS